MRLVRGLFAALMLMTLVCRPGEAQDQAHLRKALEGKRVTLKMDMPATSDGVDIYPGSNRPIDYEKVGKRTKSEGVAIKDGEVARITRVKAKVT